MDLDFCQKEDTECLNITILLNHVKVCGAVKIILEYTNYLTERGHQVNIVGYDPEPTWISFQANYIEVPSGKRMVETIPDTDIVVTTVWDQMFECYLAQKAPVIHYEHGDIYMFEFEKYDQDTQDVWRRRWSVPIPILTVSSSFAKLLEKNFQRKPQVLHNALNDKVFYPREKNQSTPKCPRILFVGPDKWSYKGIQDVLTALAIVQKNGHEIEPVWVTQTVPDSSFDGALYINPPQKKLGELYRTCDMYVCGAVYESFALPPLEAMASGCQVVSTRNLGVLEYAQHEQNCLLADIGDPDSLAQAIMELLEDKEKGKRLVQGGYKTAESFHWKPIIERLERYMYGQVMSWRNSHQKNKTLL